MSKPGSIAMLLLMGALSVARTAVAGEETAAAPATTAPIELPSWMSADVVKAAAAIGMTDAQRHDFNEFVAAFVTDHFAMIDKESRREAPDLEQRVKSRDNALVHRLDDQVRPVLTKEQWRAYEEYKKVLRARLKSAPLPQSSGGMRAQPGVGGGRG